jgi:polyphenol oxidase
MQDLFIDNYMFFKEQVNDAVFIFSTAKGNLNFNKLKPEGINNLKRLKEFFPVNQIGYLNQVHSDVVYYFDSKIHNGDALITDQYSTAIGVFTADCVPVLIYDKSKNIIAAVHSGWKGTLNLIVLKTLNKMKETYNSKPEDMVVCIGPHNRKCCYEVGIEVQQLFKNNDFYKRENIIQKHNLDLEKCIMLQLRLFGITNNIITIPICTYCNKEIELFSYRHRCEGQDYGRMFSFIYLSKMNGGRINE